MAYTPPGVYTTVLIADNVVQLPGGTRILSFIGTGRNYKTISNEAVMQPVNFVTGLSNIPVIGIQGVFDYSNSGGGIRNYVPSGSSSAAPYYNGGYYQSGTGLIAWAPAQNAYPASTTPAPGAQFFVTYSGAYAGTGTHTLYSNESVIQSGSYTEPLANYAIAIVVISGSTGSPYYATGTAANPDSLGYSTSGSGYGLTSSGTLNWYPVNPSTYTYGSVTAGTQVAPPVSGVFYTTYTAAKTLADYNPLSFTDYTQVVNTYGPDAEWNLVTSGPNAGSYTFSNLNPLTLASRIAFANGAAVVNLTQMSGLGIHNGDYQNALNLLQNQAVDVIVPLTVGSGSTIGEIPLTEKALIFGSVQTHVDTMSLPQNQAERVAIQSFGQAEIGNSTTLYTYVNEAQTLQDGRMTLVAPGVCAVEIQDPNGNFQTINVEGAFLAAAMGALSCNPNYDVATPLTNKTVTSFSSISATTTQHPLSQYLQSEKNILAAAGVCVINQNGAQIAIRHQLTTNQTSPIVGEFSVVTTTDYVSQAVRFTCEQFIGKKLVNSVVVPAVKSTILATMSQLSAVQIINSTGAVTVTVNPNNPTEILATVQYVPVFPLNRIKVTFTVRTQL